MEWEYILLETNRTVSWAMGVQYLVLSIGVDRKGEKVQGEKESGIMYHGAHAQGWDNSCISGAQNVKRRTSANERECPCTGFLAAATRPVTCLATGSPYLCAIDYAIINATRGAQQFWRRDAPEVCRTRPRSDGLGSTRST